MPRLLPLPLPPPRRDQSPDPLSGSEASSPPSLGVSRRFLGVDFGDVFGGPPRSPTGLSKPSHGLDEGDEAERGLRGWSSLGEGADTSSPRMKDLGEEFFSDIFRGSDSACSTPRRLELTSSTSSSTVRSPKRTLQQSLSKKMAKELEKAFVAPPKKSCRKSEGSDIDAGIYMSSTARDVAKMEEYSKINAHFSLHRGSSSSRFSIDQHSSSKTLQCGRTGIKGQNMEDSNCSKASTAGHFHFSFHKWASKGVMLVVPSNFNEKDKNERQFSGQPVPFRQEADTPSHNKVVQTTFPTEVENQFSGLSNECSATKKQDVVLATHFERFLSKKTQRMALQTSFILESGKDNNTQDKINELVGCTTADRPIEPVEVRNQANKVFAIHQSHAQDMPIQLEDQMSNGRVKGKVKEFVKIFNQEIPPKHLGVTESQTLGPKLNDIEKFKVGGQLKPHARYLLEEKSHKNSKRSNEPSTIKQISKEKSFHLKSEDLKPLFETTHENSNKASFEITQEPNYEFEEFQVEYVVEEKSELPPESLELEEIQNLDAKIRSWSAGKEGNIRSMLSTLQYVLWIGSGWKPIPLVDIIESNSVKRAYQKALLCLHPDKLQQRDAPMYQKYIAEKIFRILQESWNHFVTSSAL